MRSWCHYVRPEICWRLDNFGRIWGTPDWVLSWPNRGPSWSPRGWRGTFMDGLRLVEEVRRPPRWHWTSGWGSVNSHCHCALYGEQRRDAPVSSCVWKCQRPPVFLSVVCFKYRTSFTSVPVYFHWSKLQFLKICVPGNFSGNPKGDQRRAVWNTRGGGTL